MVDAVGEAERQRQDSTATAVLAELVVLAETVAPVVLVCLD